MHTGTLKMPENSHKYTNPYTKELHLEHHRLFSRPDKCFYSIYFEYKPCFETKSKKVYSNMLLVKSSENNFGYLPAFVLIIYFMKAPNIFGKAGELVSLGGVKTHKSLGSPP